MCVCVCVCVCVFLGQISHCVANFILLTLQLCQTIEIGVDLRIKGSIHHSGSLLIRSLLSCLRLDKSLPQRENGEIAQSIVKFATEGHPLKQKNQLSKFGNKFSSVDISGLM